MGDGREGRREERLGMDGGGGGVEVEMGCELGMRHVPPAPHSEAGPGSWLLGKAAGGGEGRGKWGGTRRAGGFVWEARIRWHRSGAFLGCFSSLLGSCSLLFFWGGGFGSSSSTGVHLGDLRILAMYLGRRRRIGGCRK